jgi:hypothetical protein
MWRKGEPGIPDSRTDPISALPDCRIRETHHSEVGESERHVDLDVNRVSIHAKDRRAPKACEHGAPDCKDQGRRSRYQKVGDFQEAVRGVAEIALSTAAHGVRNCNLCLSLRPVETILTPARRRAPGAALRGTDV